MGWEGGGVLTEEESTVLHFECWSLVVLLCKEIRHSLRVVLAGRTCGFGGTRNGVVCWCVGQAWVTIAFVGDYCFRG
jgi:hypothetical protein